MERSAFDALRMKDDMALRGWMVADLARVSGLTKKTVGRFLSGETQTNKTALRLANALGYSVKRYLISARQNVA